ncbi:o-succinylbenzoate synthase [Vibrio methylphosphonaticus]|uniref:o-succinylbenzoate synthase n=1 Tax=Vibrio methylphosphonaticus TaxID=2946866 RepID=UPI00202A0A8D|nr:o-succinylbenzoate synthase [Vibrio methylphosphonaticus]MCL9776126.1 o-succinylbenzoate synthase [Vibrio methylphosphonaticus]
MRQAKLYRYTLPMDSGVILRDTKLTAREGWVVELIENGKHALGEIAPLPGFSQESLQEAGNQAQHYLESWVKKGQLGSDLDEYCPSVAFGLSCAVMELASRLPNRGNYQAAPLCSGDPDDLLPILNTMSGRKVAKIKVGMYEAIRDGMIVSLFLESIPDLTLRLDANRSWSLEKANKFASYIAPSLRERIAFIEEPCKTSRDSLSFAGDTGIAIAWDETLQEAVRASDFAFDSLTGVKTLIIKPTLVGSLEKCITLIEAAHQQGIQVVISSSLESSIGLNHLARFSQWQVPNVTPGLDTMQLFAAQLEVAWPNCRLPISTLDEQTLYWQS